ncbi:MAG: ISL3 family transposase, partial [Gammaproteobacteria bacterium]
MRDKELYKQIMGIHSPWEVTEVELSVEAEEVRVHGAQAAGTQQTCPHCGTPCSGYDKRYRTWRHLDTCQFKTLLVAEVPRVKCSEHGVVTVVVPWAESGSGFTALYEALVIDWLKEASIQAVSRRLSLSWNAIDGIMQRAVKRGLARRQTESVSHIGVDETSFKKGHDYVTVVSDGKRVLHVADERKSSSLASYYATLTNEQKAGIVSVSMDMWPAYIKATLENIPDARAKIAFDKFHVAKYLGEAVDKVRKHEHKVLMEEGWEDRKGTKYVWLTNLSNLSRKRQCEFKVLRESTLKTARAWAIKDLAMRLWNYVSRTWAEKRWKQWLSWAVRCRLEPIRAVAKLIKTHLWGILNAILLRVSNGGAESINSRIKMIKIRGRGFRNKARYINAIYFHMGR